jgi:hypothetical protein
MSSVALGRLKMAAITNACVPKPYSRGDLAKGLISTLFSMMPGFAIRNIRALGE